MPHTETFYVSTSDNSVRKSTDNRYSYFQGENKGKAKYLIKVFKLAGHKEFAERIRDIIDKDNLDNSISFITIECKR